MSFSRLRKNKSNVARLLPCLMCTHHQSRKLQSLDPTLHWFCDRQENVPQSDGHEAPEQELPVKARRELVFASLILLASEDLETAAQKDFLIYGVNRQLEQCDLCVVEYYKAKRTMMLKLRE